MVVLVAYATGHGSSRGVADRIAGRLQRRGAGRNWPAIEAWADLVATQMHVKSGV